MDLEQRLLEAIDPDYLAFHAHLVPGKQILGIRVPVLESIAKELPRSFLDASIPSTYEYSLLYGFVLGRTPLAFEERILYLERWMEMNDNWATNDTVCSRQKWMRKSKEALVPYFKKWIDSNDPWKQRFVYTSLLLHYKEKRDLDRIFALIERPYVLTYYTQMGLAWLLSDRLVLFPKETLAYLQQSSLDDFTYNKALQKARESKRVSSENKEVYQRMKRR